MNVNEDGVELHEFAVTVIHYVDAADEYTARDMVHDVMTRTYGALAYDIQQVDKL